MKYQFKGQTYWGEWVTGSLIQGKTTTFIVPPHLIFSQTLWTKVDPETVKLLDENDFETKDSVMNQKSKTA